VGAICLRAVLGAERQALRPWRICILRTGRSCPAGRGITGDPKILSDLGTTFPQNLYDVDLINNAIERASKLDIPVPAAEFQNEKFNVRPAAGEDLGFIALSMLAFQLISPTIGAVYWAYLFLFAASILLFWFAFRNDRIYTSVLVLICAVFTPSSFRRCFRGRPGCWNRNPRGPRR